MALPSSGQISGSQIANELGVAATNISLGGMADSASFLPPDQYSDFYGYFNGTSYQGSAQQPGTKKICNQNLNVTYYHDGSASFPTTNDTIYTNSGGTTTVGAGYIKSNSLSYVLTNSSGVVTNVYPCII
tara:strand:+ start:3450 stop:3839 length:390 start_codon:yes stop_codon:yes gene_type:complete